MKNKLFFAILGLILIAFVSYYGITVFMNKKAIEGYWCNYDATGSLIISLSDNYKLADKQKVEAYIKTIKGMATYDFVSKENFANSENKDTQLYDTYFVYISINQEISAVIKDIKELPGVHQVKENTIKSNLTIYHFKQNSYSLYNALYNEAINTGSYTFKDQQITLADNTIIYVKKGYLCGDQDCLKVFNKTNQNCE